MATETATAEPAHHDPTDIPIALKSTLVDAQGVTYREFRRTLTPRYGRIWRDIAAGWAILAAVPLAIAFWQPTGVLFVVAALAGALVVGYTLAYLNNFFHEAAHHNLLASRAANDRATNLVLGWLFGSSIETYRAIHFQHHRALGTTMDSENSYFDALRVRYLVEGLTGIKVVRTLRRYNEVEQSRGEKKGKETKEGSDRTLWSLVAAVSHLGIAALLAVFGSPAAGLAWLGGVLLVFPFCVSLRQLLEHRSEDAQPEIDYRTVDHGQVNRLFGTGPLASTLGSAGFNRHALHHWEPQLSYTRLADLQRWLEGTQVGDLVRARQTTYADTFLRLLEL